MQKGINKMNREGVKLVIYMNIKCEKTQEFGKRKNE